MKTGNLEHVEVLQQLSRLGRVFFRLLGWSEPLPRKLDWSWFFMVFGWSLLLPGYQWTWASFRQLPSAVLTAYVDMGTEGQANVASFRGFLKLF